MAVFRRAVLTGWLTHGQSFSDVKEHVIPALPGERLVTSILSRGVKGARGSTVVLRFLCGAQQDFAGERLWSLGYDHRHGMRYVAGLQHALRLLSFMRTEFGLHGTGRDHRHADVVSAEFFGHGIS